MERKARCKLEGCGAEKIVCCAQSLQKIILEHNKSSTNRLLTLTSRLVVVSIYSIALISTHIVNSQQITYQHSPSAVQKISANSPQHISSDLFAFVQPTKDDHNEVQHLKKQNHDELIKKSSANGYDHVSSADLPAEFRDADGGVEESSDTPKEQSKLAKLCQQTSSVLASVLPAPFGGHKRSILCQFFGQVPMIRQSQKQQQLQTPLIQNPILASQFPTHFDNHYPFESHPSVAVLQQPKQPPITMAIASGMHPIQLVLEQQQRQHFIHPNIEHMTPLRMHPQTNQMQAHPIISTNTQSRPHNQQSQEQDLKSSASIIDYSYHQKLEPPVGMQTDSQKSDDTTSNAKRNIKYSSSISNLEKGSSFSPMSIPPAQQMSTSGWRIFNQPPSDLLTTQSPTKLDTPSSTTSTEKPISALSSSTVSSIHSSTVQKEKSLTKNESLSTLTSKISSTTSSNKVNKPTESPNPLNNNNNNTNSNDQLLVMGKPPGFAIGSSKINDALSKSSTASFMHIGRDAKQLSTIGKRSEALKSTTRAALMGEADERSEVRTIEVVAQVNNVNNNNNNTIDLPKRSSTTPATVSTTQKPLAPSTDLHQVQKREELVIASINNLTRIAFGNHLRDTVKVINKLIDQQSSLFNSGSTRSKIKVVNSLDPLLTSESKLTDNSRKSFPSTGIKLTSTTTKRAQSKSTSDLTKLSTTLPANKSRNKQISTQQQTFKSIKKPKKQSLTETATSTTQQKLQQTNSTHMSKDNLLFASLKNTQNLSSQKAGRSASSFENEPISNNRKLSASTREVRRLSSITPSTPRTSRGSSSSSMILPGQRQKATPPTDEFEPLPTVTISDIHRDRSPWQFSSAPSTPAPFKTVLPVKGSSQQQVATLSPRLTTKQKTLELDKSAVKQHDFTWNLPFNGLYQPDSLETTVSDRKTISEVLKNWSSTRKQSSAGSGNAMGTTPSLTSKQALVLNRLESTKSIDINPKMDSLTALKMSLTTQASPPLLSANKNQTSGTQSRWIPTVTRPLSTTSTTTSTMTPSTSTTTTSTTITPIENELSRVTNDVTHEGPSEYMTYATSKEPMSQNDLNELRASDSISRYTTHWSQVDAGNEILATTRRFYQQPMPQLANAGEFFNAETIASWPEKYQAALSSTFEGGKTTRSLMSETTRRSGETFDSASSKIPTHTTTTARHRFSDSTTTDQQQQSSSTSLPYSTQSNQRTTPADFASKDNHRISNNYLSGSVTILPANHKLSATTVDQSTLSSTQTPSSDMRSETAYINLSEEDDKDLEAKSTTKVETRETQSPALPSYTLINPVLNNLNYSSPSTAERNDSLEAIIENGGIVAQSSDKFPLISDDLIMSSGSTTKHKLQQISSMEGQQQNLSPTNSGANNTLLRPPYINMSQSSEDVEQLQKDFDLNLPMSGVNNQSQVLQRPYVSRKLYELLVPSTRNFVGPQNPLNQARFNLSALKFLAQNLLSSSTNQNNSSPSTATGIDLQISPELNNEQNYTYGGNASEKLINLLSASFPASYYGLLLNDSSSDSLKNSTGLGKSILSRTGSLFNDIRQLEQKKAAAILAAIRYQVPSPLVRPWDTNSDIHTLIDYNNQQTTGLARSDILSQSEANVSDLDLKSLLMAKANALAGAALLKQRLIPRGELEARLRGYKKLKQDRSDREHQKDLDMRRADVSYSFDGDISSGTDQVKFDEIDADGRFVERPPRTNISKILFEKLLPKDALAKYRTTANKSGEPDGLSVQDYDAIDLSKGAEVHTSSKDPGKKQQEELEAEAYPKYIRLNDYQTAWSVKPPRSPFAAPLESNSSTINLPRNHSETSTLVDRLKSTSARVIELLSNKNNKRDNYDIDDDIGTDKKNVKHVSSVDKVEKNPQDDEIEKKYQFQCIDRQPGFYPDIGSTCRTFYHCSNTGHLLTFNCPQQTRFDEKSLKCGPWFEIPCDLGRGKLLGLV